MPATRLLHIGSNAPARYWAFISYSHDNAGVARRLHKALETLVVPSGVAETRRLHPIFLDRDDLPATTSLTESIVSSLRDSRCLIVLCSRDAARSPWVNQEISTYQSIESDGPILPVVIDSSSQRGPFDSVFPPALRGSDALAADLRPGGDKWRMAVLKLAAGILQVDLDQLVRRDQLRRRRLQLAWALALTTVLAAFVAGQVYLDKLNTEKERRALISTLYGEECLERGIHRHCTSTASAQERSAAVKGLVELERTTLKQTPTLEYAYLEGVSLNNADLAGVRLVGADLEAASLQGANLRGANLLGASLIGARLTGAVVRMSSRAWSETTGPRTDLSGAILTEANLTDAVVSGSDLQGTNLQGAILTRTDFLMSNLSGASLSKATLWSTRFESADLSGADLSDSELRRAIFTCANLDGANLAGALVDDLVLDAVIYDGNTVWPEGFHPPPTDRQGCTSVDGHQTGIVPPARPGEIIECTRERLERLADTDARAALAAGLGYEVGAEGFERNVSRAVDNYKRAVKAGAQGARYHLAWMHETGQGVDKDETRAAELYASAALTGDPYAQYNLAEFYFLGRGGLPKDSTKGLSWATRAADAGDEHAQNLVGYLYASGLRDTPQDIDKARAYFRRAAARDNPLGRINLEKLSGQAPGRPRIRARPIIHLHRIVARQIQLEDQLCGLR